MAGSREQTHPSGLQILACEAPIVGVCMQARQGRGDEKKRKEKAFMTGASVMVNGLLIMKSAIL